MSGLSGTFIATLIFTIAVIVFLGFMFWYMFFTGEKVNATVEDYVHPDDAKRKNGRTEITWCICFSFREKNGKKTYIYSKRHFDTRAVAAKDFPKGKKVNIRRYKELGDSHGPYKCVILDDHKDLNLTIIYTVLLVVAASAILVGTYLMQQGN